MDLRYPIGPIDWNIIVPPDLRPSLIEQIAEAPVLLRQAISGLDDQQLDTPYREGGWTVRQVVHHLPDSHMNAYIRYRMALTEDHPTIKPYDEAKWAELSDARTLAPAASLALLESLHARWVALLEQPCRFRLQPRIPASGNRNRAPRCEPGSIRVARPPPYRSDYGVAAAHGLVDALTNEPVS